MTKNDHNNYCIILAGGKGRRLWPSSRNAYPKQFLDFFGVGRTQLQQTYDRMARIVPADHIYINTNEEYVEFVRQQLPDVSSEHILSEPIHRNTAPSVAWAAHRIAMQNPEACAIRSGCVQRGGVLQGYVGGTALCCRQQLLPLHGCETYPP